MSRTGSDYNVASLAKVINDPAINELIVRTWIERAYGQRRSTLVFAVNIDHVNALVHEFHARGIDARGIHSGIPAADRQHMLEAFRRAEFPVLINCGTHHLSYPAILTEGADVPPIDCVLLARPTQSQNLFSQMIGRGMRLSPETGKQDCLILDLVGNLSNDIVCTPTLFGLYDEQPIEGTCAPASHTDETSESLRARADAWKAKQASEPSATPRQKDPWTATSLAFVDYDDPAELYTAMRSSPSRVLQKASQNAWVDCGDDTYVLSGWDHSYLKLQRSGSEYIGTYYPRNPDWLLEIQANSPYWQKRQVLRSEDFEHALRGCDTFMSKMASAAGRSPLWLRRSAVWRKRPASPRALEMLQDKLRAKGELDGDLEESPWANATHGTVNTVLTRLRHGGKSRWRRAMKLHNKSVEKAQRTPKQLGVRVGPLPKSPES